MVEQSAQALPAAPGNRKPQNTRCQPLHACTPCHRHSRHPESRRSDKQPGWQGGQTRLHDPPDRQTPLTRFRERRPTHDGVGSPLPGIAKPVRRSRPHRPRACHFRRGASRIQGFAQSASWCPRTRNHPLGSPQNQPSLVQRGCLPFEHSSDRPCNRCRFFRF